MEALKTARGILADITPLARDCGALCGHICCADSEDGMNGMLLFPGEEALPLPDGAEIRETSYRCGGEMVFLMTCPGQCDRSLRPLSCRVFPLIARPKKQGGFSLRMDERARFCPLHSSGDVGLCPEFRQGVRDVYDLLWAYPRQRAFIEMLGEEQRELRALAKGFTRGRGGRGDGERWGSAPDPA